ncbi:MAG: DoxX family membrane protein, partial [Bacteroidaceae bacterium]|nr:DoxX family membrane protein [Bacteroidaceae bacterium]
MKNSRLFSVLRWLLVNACRMILSVALIFSGAVKMIDPRGTEYKIKDYALAFGLDDMLALYMPLLLSMALALTEFCLGVNLLFGSNRRWTSRVVLVAFMLFTPLTLYLAIENPVSDCGCFGDAWVLTNWQTFGKNVLLLACAAVVCVWYRMQTRLVSEHAQWLVNLYTWMYAFILTLYCAYTLPVIDFRPYHIGSDLKAQMQWDDTDRVPPISDL